MLTTSFIKGFGDGSVLSRGGYWTSRITVKHREGKKNKNQTVAMFYYAALDANNDKEDNIVEPSFEDPQDPSRITGISGLTSSLGKFKISFVMNKDSASQVHQFFHTTVNSKGPDQFTNDISQRLRLYSSDEKGGKRNPKNNIIGLDPKFEGNDPANFVAIQINFKVPFTLDVVYHLEDTKDNSNQEWLMGEEYTQRLQEKELLYDKRFEDTFGLKDKGFDEKAIKFAQATIR
jgi:mannosyl-oligosaccharide glucosidase